jgi:inner membrane protein involved in colicin E2 resistance
MRGYLRIFGIFVVFLVATAAWLVLGGVTSERDRTQTEKLRHSVQSLWGSPQRQAAPTLTFRWDTEELFTRTETVKGVEKQTEEVVKKHHEEPVQLSGSDIDVTLGSDLRRKGLAWYSLYDVKFNALYSYVHQAEHEGEVEVASAFPDVSAVYDDFRLEIDGVDGSRGLDASGGVVRAVARVKKGQRLTIRTRYQSRGLDVWEYVPSNGVARLENFKLTMHTNFRDIDFPSGTLSPETRSQNDRGYTLGWTFAQIVTGYGIGMVMPTRIQPGELASELALSAPISLFFFFVVVFVLATLRNIDIHPLNYFLIAGAFFAFHLLFAYSVDHLTVEQAFTLSSAVSVFLVVSYLRLVVSARFACVEAALAQLVYLVGFSLAHFWDGFTGLTTTVLAIITLFVLMQLTGRVRWSLVLGPGGEGQVSRREEAQPAMP